MQLPVTTTRIEVKDNETGALGHVANWAYAYYMQLARRDFFAEVNRKTGYNRPPIVVNLNVDFFFSCFPEDEIDVVTWCSHIGNKSLRVCNEIYANEKIAARGTATIVGVNDKTKLSEPLPGGWVKSDYPSEAE